MSQKRITADEFKERHRQTDTAFTRVRSLPFALVLVLILRKSVKSLQNGGERSDDVARAETSDSQCLFAGQVQAKTYRIY